MAKNVKFNYLYRDAGNYKSWGAIIFANPNELSIQEIEIQFERLFFHGELFIAKQIDVTEVFLYSEDDASEDDHCFHEYESIELTEEEPNDPYNRTIVNFLKKVEEESATGWNLFNPQKNQRRKPSVVSQ